MSAASFFSTRRWCAVNVQPQREATAREELADRDFEVHLPVLVEWAVHPRRGRYERRAPLFPGYLFVALNPDADQWHRILEPRSVIQLLCFERQTPRGPEMRPRFAEAGKIESLNRLALEGDGTVWIDYSIDRKGVLQPGPLPKRSSRRARGARRFQPGQLVRITEGPFTSFTGVIEQYVGRSETVIRLWVDIFGRSVPKTLLEAQAEPV